MSIQNCLEYFTYISPIILCLGTIIGVIYFNRLDKIHRVLWLYLCCSLMIDIISRILGATFQNNLSLFFAVGLLDIVIFTYIYFQLASKKNIVLLIGAIGAIFIVTEMMNTNVNDVQTFQEYSNVVVSFSILSMSIVFLSESLQHASKSVHYLLLNMACLVFFAFQLIFLLPLNFLINQEFVGVFLIWALRNLFLYTFYCILISLIWKNGKILKS